MGRKMDALLGRGFKPHKFKALVNLSISRLAVLKNQRQSRSNQARSDVIQLLHLGHHDPALLRVEHVIKEQKMLDTFLMLESYINIVVERVDLIEHQRVCPDELREAVSGLLYASSRCGDFPELQELRTIFTSRYGKEFASSAIDLRNNCGVNPKLLQKMTARQPDLETKMKVLKEIASENNIVLQLKEASSDPIEIEENLEVSNKQNQFEVGPSTHNDDDDDDDAGFNDSMHTRRKYRDVADAAEAAFQSAAHAAAAARAAVELSRSTPRDPDSPHSPNTRPRKISTINNPTQLHVHNDTDLSSLSSGSARDNLAVPTMSFDGAEQAKLLDKDLVFDESDNEDSYSLQDQSFPQNDSQPIKPSGVTRMGYVQRFDKGKGPISMWTRQVRGY